MPIVSTITIHGDVRYTWSAVIFLPASFYPFANKLMVIFVQLHIKQI